MLARVKMNPEGKIVISEKCLAKTFIKTYWKIKISNVYKYIFFGVFKIKELTF